MSQITLICVYKRKTKWPWNSKLTIILLANTVHTVNLKIDLSRYIYQHRDADGKIVGISVSRSIQKELECERYIDGDKMHIVLVYFQKEISVFCKYFYDDFKSTGNFSPDLFFLLASNVKSS